MAEADDFVQVPAAAATGFGDATVVVEVGTPAASAADVATTTPTASTAMSSEEVQRLLSEANEAAQRKTAA